MSSLYVPPSEFKDFCHKRTFLVHFCMNKYLCQSNIPQSLNKIVLKYVNPHNFCKNVLKGKSYCPCSSDPFLLSSEMDQWRDTEHSQDKAEEEKYCLASHTWHLDVLLPCHIKEEILPIDYFFCSFFCCRQCELTCARGRQMRTALRKWTAGLAWRQSSCEATECP